MLRNYFTFDITHERWTEILTWKLHFKHVRISIKREKIAGNIFPARSKVRRKPRRSLASDYVISRGKRRPPNPITRRNRIRPFWRLKYLWKFRVPWRFTFRMARSAIKIDFTFVPKRRNGRVVSECVKPIDKLRFVWLYVGSRPYRGRHKFR